MTTSQQLFQPITVGQLNLKHRIVLAPLTRYRSSNPGHVPILPMMKDYYAQRASAPGTLLITEATYIAARAGGQDYVPGIYSEEQIAAWKEITDAVHAAGSFIIVQLWALGRAARPKELWAEDPSFPYVSASDVKIQGVEETPRPLTVVEVKEYVGLYAQAAKNAMKAGFDGVEIHAANGYLPNQFLDELVNRRTDDYGGSVENRSRFVLEIAEAVTAAIGPGRTGIRFSPWSTYNDLNPSDPLATYEYLVSKIKTLHPDFAYLHVVEPRIKGDGDEAAEEAHHAASNHTLRELWGSKPYISAGGYNRETALIAAERGNELIAFGRQFLANPDLLVRLMRQIPQNKYDRSTFYLHASPKGYTDYPFADVAVEVAA